MAPKAVSARPLGALAGALLIALPWSLLAHARAAAAEGERRDARSRAGAPTSRAPAAVRCLSSWYQGEAAWLPDAGWGFRLPSGAFLPWEAPPGGATTEAPAALDGGASPHAATPRRRAPPPRPALEPGDEHDEVSTLSDVFAVPYVPGPIVPLDATDAGTIQEPGRARIQQLFEETYGRTREEVSSRLVKVRLFGVRYPFHGRAAPALARVAQRLDTAAAHDRKLGAFLKDIGGTWNYRRISRSRNLSTHAWGIAVDLNAELGHYWRWQRRGEPLRWRNRVPQAIVDAFEAEGFIWGGRWLHYDTMHFEYRPELQSPACREAVASSPPP